MNARPWMLRLLIGAVVLPVALAVVLMIWQLLETLGDQGGGQLLRNCGLLLLALWVTDLVLLLLLMAWRQIQRPQWPGHRARRFRRHADRAKPRD